MSTFENWLSQAEEKITPAAKLTFADVMLAAEGNMGPATYREFSSAHPRLQGALAKFEEEHHGILDLALNAVAPPAFVRSTNSHPH